MGFRVIEKIRFPSPAVLIVSIFPINSVNYTHDSPCDFHYSNAHEIPPLHPIPIYGIITMYYFIVSALHHDRYRQEFHRHFRMPFSDSPKGEGVQGMDAEGKGYRET